MLNTSSAGVLLQNDLDNDLLDGDRAEQSRIMISPFKQSDTKLVDRSHDDYSLEFASASPLTKNLKYAAREERFGSTMYPATSNYMYRTLKDNM